MAVHERVWETAEAPVWKPRATYGLLGAIGVVYLLQMLVTAEKTTVVHNGQTYLVPANIVLHNLLFTIDTDWIIRPWSLVTSTLAHSYSGFSHILGNGLMLFFFGPSVERVLGTKRFLILFLVAGALSGVLQVHLQAAYEMLLAGGSIGDAFVPGRVRVPALGASGALMMLMGFMVVLAPRQTVMFNFFIPMPLWVVGLLYLGADLFGLLNPNNGIGNFAHLSGAAIGAWYAVRFKQELRTRGMRLQF